ncbi:aminotransferase class I/II-fold pyridoxal phosphate-dependent enzyme [Novispirillum itersonii]|uniref:8-amino-7-oxononanoate synthase n=1 Tax=Novispirillum itersonii TaxID=189 RepID=A0A7X0DN65_NOVIT|nr:8-amino-7-oxononanoate synthase [Novispirillum itersonii]MBB6211680.1 8-amino-7-oxononanoate synthase [Novispirillum itersonii]
MDRSFRLQIAARLADLEAASRRRSLTVTAPDGGGVRRVTRNGQPLINFSSNDYLGLAHHPALAAAAARAAADHGTGATASRLVSGTLPLHDALESRLAALKGSGAALVMAGGFATNASVLAALLDADIAGKAPLVFMDRLAHASMHDGVIGAGVRQIRYHHNDLAHLETLLSRHADAPGPRLIVTESVFSMDGDRADLPGLCALAEKYGAELYVDEAHATGVLGPQGAGLCADPAVKGRVGMVMGTFGKALGGYGAFVACDALLRDWLVTKARGFIYATALPPPVLGAVLAALDLIPQMEAARQRLTAHADTVRGVLHGLGIDTLTSDTQIIPAVIGAEADTLAAARFMEQRGLLTVAIRPPTVPPGSGRLRLALSAAHTPEDIAALTDAFTAFARAGA